MRRALLAFLVAGITAFPALAEKMPWVRIRPTAYSYKGMTYSCIAGTGPGSPTFSAASVYLSGDVEGGMVTRAYLNQETTWPPYPESYLELTTEELESMEVYRDAQGRFWLARLAASPRTVAFLVNRLAPLIACFTAPPPVATVEPSPVRFEFELDAVKAGVYVSHSQKVKFEGVGRDGRPYDGSLQLKQELP